MANFLKSIAPRTIQSVRSIFLSSARFESSRVNPTLHKVSNIEKKCLVWTKKYKTVEEIPDVLPVEIVDKARNRMRIRVANYMMVATLIACIFVSMSGKRLRDKGESVTKMNLDWHAKMNEEYAKKTKEEK